MDCNPFGGVWGLAQPKEPVGAKPEAEVETLRGGRKREALPRKQKCVGEEQVPAGPTANVL